MGQVQVGVAVQFVCSLPAFHPLRMLCGLHAIFFSHLCRFSGCKSSTILYWIRPWVALHFSTSKELLSSDWPVQTHIFQMNLWRSPAHCDTLVARMWRRFTSGHTTGLSFWEYIDGNNTTQSILVNYNPTENYPSIIWNSIVWHEQINSRTSHHWNHMMDVVLLLFILLLLLMCN